MTDMQLKALLFMKGNSERVPGKNVRLFCGRPLFFWILDSLQQSGVVSEIIINTDSEEIASMAKSNYDVTIHMRPIHLLNIISNEASQIMDYDLSLTDGDVFLQSHSTNPLLKPSTIRRAVERYFAASNEYDSLFSVTPLQTRLFHENWTPINHDPGNLIKTQNLPFVYEENSCIYIFSRASFVKNGSRIGRTPLLFPIDRYDAIDIDEEYDFLFAETIMQHRLEYIKE